MKLLIGHHKYCKRLLFTDFVKTELINLENGIYHFRKQKILDPETTVTSMHLFASLFTFVLGSQPPV